MKIKITNSMSMLLKGKTRAFLALIGVFSISLTNLMAQSPYCDPYYASQNGNCTTYNMSINAVELKQGSNVLYSRSHNTFGYNGCNASSGDYFLIDTASLFTLKAGGSYSIGFTTGPNYPVGVGVWIDLNADNDFTDANEWMSTGWCTPYLTAGSSTLQYFSFKVPSGVKTGKTRLRIRTNYSACTNSGDACSNYNYGEAEDYTITLSSDPDDAGITAITPPLCKPDLVVNVGNLGNNSLDSVRVGWSVNGTYQKVNYITKPISQAGSTNLTLSPNYTFVDGTTYTVKVFTSFPNGKTDPDKSNDTSRLTFKYIGPSGTPKTTDAVKCGPGKAPMVATSPFQTDSVVWYDKATGGNIVARGKNTMSPSLFLGVNTFYAQSFKMGSPTSLANGFSGTTILSGNTGSYNGTMVDITPSTDLAVDSFAIRFYQNYTGSTYEIWYRVGAYAGNERTPSAWTFVGDGVARLGASNRGFLKIKELALKGGVTYSFYITTTPTTGNDLYATYGTSTFSNSDVSITGGSYIYGQWASNGIYAPYCPDLAIYYRKSSCPSARVPITITVNPSPNGAGFEKGTPFQTTQPNTLGVISNPDIVAEGDELNYELTPPTGYSNSGYGTKWKVLNLTVKSKKGIDIPKSYYTWTNPSSGGPGKLTFKPDANLTDTFIIVGLRIEDMGPYFCDSSILRHIFVAPRPVPDFKFNQPVCDGDAVLFDNLSSISSGGLSYKWDFGTGNPADTSDAYTTVFKFPTYGSYKVSLRTISLPYNYEETKTITVVVTEIPKIDFKVLNACEKVAINFTNNTTHSGTVTYAWDFGDPSTTLDRSTLKSPTWTYPNPGAYKVTLRATASGCTSELSKNANQFATPKANFTFPALICDKSEVQFTNGSTIKNGNMGYKWTFGDGSVSNFANPTHEYSDAISKSVKLKAVSEFGCTDSISKNITLFESPRADFNWGAACNLTTTKFNFTGSKPALPVITTYDWNFSGEGSTTVENPSKLFSIVGKKKVTLTMVSNNGCSDNITKEVNVKLQSKADFSSEDVCEDDDAVFINKSAVSAGNLNYNWKFGDGSNSASQSPRHRYNIVGQATTFNVTLVAVVPGGCSDSITKAVTVNANPDAGFKFTTSGRMVYFTANQAGATLYQWRFGDGGSSVAANPNYNYTQLPSGKYTACLALVNAAGCFSETCQTINITGGVDKLSKLSGVKVYPNPNKGNFTVTVEDPKSDISIAVYNLLGDVVKTIETNSLKSVYQIDLNVANGVYLVKVTNGGLVATQKVTVNK